jgi:Flp pilus assembly pilin Flp
MPATSFGHRLRQKIGQRVNQKLGHNFTKEEDGSAALEFAVVAPLLMLILFSTFELGLLTVRETLLERALDLTVRDIRLGTGTAPQHDELKARICDRAYLLHDCSSNLRIEMIQLDPRNWTDPRADADCTDRSRDVEPVRAFVHGRENEMMLVRVCVKVEPLFPTSGLGEALHKDGAGDYSLIARSAFVQEPR